MKNHPPTLIHPKLIKPSRTTPSSPKLKKSRVINNSRRGIETSIIIDLNVLSTMNKVVRGEINYQNSGLSKITNFLNKTPNLYLSPGFAIAEAEQEYVRKIHHSYEKFLSKYCPRYIDHPNSIKFKANEFYKPKEYINMSKEDKIVSSIFYLAMLQIALISKKFSKNTPIQKFNRYISYMSNNANLVSAIESEVAKYCFCDLNEISSVKRRLFCKNIKNNFRKGGKTAKKIYKNCLNSARDIMYFRFAAILSNEQVNGHIQDTWILTADKGLVNLSESIYFVSNFANSDSKAVKLNRFKEQNESVYWNHCDYVSWKTIEMRKLRSNFFGYSSKKQTDIFHHLERCIIDSEQEISQLTGR